MALFQKSVLNKHLNHLDESKVASAYTTFQQNYNPQKIDQIKQLKEEEYQNGFLRDIFVDVLGYTLRPDDNYNLQREFKNQNDDKKADDVILKDDKALAIIELKSTNTKDLTKVTNQAFNYKNQRFINRLKEHFEIEKISKNLNNFYDHDFKTLITELIKQKITLSQHQQDEWEDYFTTYKTEINNPQTQITQTDNEIDQMVYELYRLIDEEIGVVEGG